MLALHPGSNRMASEPFPHLVLDQALPPGLFAALQASYPECPPASGPTGRTIHRGDAAFDAQIAAHSCWRELYHWCNSPVFVSALAALFADEIDRSCRVERAALRFTDHIESRAEKETTRIANPALPPEALHVRFDFMQGMESYSRAPHLDHRRRLATMLVYFDAPGPETFSGGELVLHDATGAAVRTVPPAENQAVLFPCSERSWHSVAAVTACNRPRRFIQVSVSSCHDLWPDARLPGRAAPSWGKRLLRGLVRAA